jgi:hypothetical protein
LEGFPKNIDSPLKDCMKTRAPHENVDVKCLSKWHHNAMKDCKSNIDRLDRRNRSRNDMILNSPETKDYLKKLQQDLVFVPTDKASNNITIVCKKSYIEQSMKELDIFTDSGQKDLKDKTYATVDKDFKSIVRRHRNYMSKNLSNGDIPGDVPLIYWIPKTHKKPYSKQRYIAASQQCSTKPLSAILTKSLTRKEKQNQWIRNSNTFKPYF